MQATDVRGAVHLSQSSRCMDTDNVLCVKATLTIVAKEKRVSDKSDNIVYLKNKVSRTKDPVPKVCEVAAETFEHILILGQNKDGAVQMITTMQDPAEILWYMEAARFGIMLGASDEDD